MSASYEPSAGTISTTLLERVRSNEPQAWERLVALYGPVIYQWARRARLDANDAADVMQETFRSVLRTISEFRRDRATNTFRGWLWTIVHNKIRDHARRERFHGGAAGGTDAHQQMQQVAEPSESVEMPSGGNFNLSRRALELVRGEFEPRTWQAFWQVTIDGRRPDLVAEELGMSVGTVYSAKCRILRRLREELAADL